MTKENVLFRPLFRDRPVFNEEVFLFCVFIAMAVIVAFFDIFVLLPLTAFHIPIPLPNNVFLAVIATYGSSAVVLTISMKAIVERYRRALWLNTVLPVAFMSFTLMCLA